jgi:2-dehydro-3-deoxyphosphogluconate aldolase/(4S)-4-hydroxy-2-oxoglutarate aldolase
MVIEPVDATGPLRAALGRHRILAIIRGSDPGAAIQAGLTLVDAGVRLVEVSLTCAGALDVISALAAELPADIDLGAGTVLSEKQVDEVTERGAQFIVTPALVPAVGYARAHGLPVLGGAYTPSEVLAMSQTGAIVKLFPAREAGGANYLRALRGPFPDLEVVAVGGVGMTETAEFLDAGALAVGVGGPLLGDAADGGDLDALASRARQLIAVVAGR